MDIYFHHIGKTAGTSFRRYLIEHMGEENVSPMLRGVKYSDAIRDYGRFAAIGGHISALPGDTLAKDRISFTFLRDPIERVLSEYSFRTTVHQLGRSTNNRTERGLDAWLDTLSSDEQLVLNAHLDATWAFGWNRASTPNMEQRIAASKEALETFDVLGLQDRFGDSVELFSRRVGWPAPAALPRENTTPDRITKDDLSDATLGRLRRLLEPDFEVYQHGVMIFGGHLRVILRAFGHVADTEKAAERQHPSPGQIKARDSRQGDVAMSGAEASRLPVVKDHEKELTITGVAVRGQLSDCSTIQVGETAAIEVGFCARVTESRLTVGFLLRDHAGALVFGTNTRLLGDNLEVKPGDFVVAFQFRNELGLGKYSVGVSLHRGLSELEKCFHRCEHAADFEVVDTVTEPFEGRIHLHVETSIRATSHGALFNLTPSKIEGEPTSWLLVQKNPILNEFAARLTADIEVGSVTRASDMLVNLRIANVGSEVWNAFGRRSVRVSYHWLGAGGAFVEFHGLRTMLPRDIGPGESIVLPCFLRTPETSGTFELLWTLVQEEVAWFDDRNVESRRAWEVLVT